MPQADDQFAQALSLARNGRFADALAMLEQHLTRRPGDRRALTARANLHMELGDPAAALASCEQALALDPTDPATWVTRGNAEHRLARHEPAVASYDRALALDPGLAIAHANRARALIDLDRPEAALASADAALALRADYFNAWMHRGVGLLALGRYDEALASFQSCVGLQPNSHEALDNLGVALTAVGRHAEAIAALDLSIQREPARSVARYHRAHARLLVRDFAGGWRDHEARWDVAAFVDRSAGFVTPALRARLSADITAGAMAGARVPLVSEQGVGDQVMFSSILPDLIAQAGAITCVCDRRLIGLMANSFPAVAFRDIRDTGPVDPDAFDRVIAMGSLGGLYRNRLGDFPGTPYVRPREAVVEGWARRLGPRSGALRVGLSWRGGTRTTRMDQRSLPLAALAPLLGLPDCEFVSLQYGDAQAEVAAANAQLNSNIRIFPAEEIDDFEELAGLVLNLDVVASVQTTIVHLAGALGTECLTLVPHRPEWRYTAEGSTMPWYGSVRLFRQPGSGSWDPVIGQVAEALSHRLGRSARS